MPDEFSVKLLGQTTDNIQKLFDLSTRIDERVKSLQMHQKELEGRVEELSKRHLELIQKCAILETHRMGDTENNKKLNEVEHDVDAMDKKIVLLETARDQSSDRWNRIATFVIQLIWVILAAYLLTKLNLQPPAVP
jgi:predicted RNase H-like nuclease (RuvC/YqgF family)